MSNRNCRPVESLIGFWNPVPWGTSLARSTATGGGISGRRGVSLFTAKLGAPKVNTRQAAHHGDMFRSLAAPGLSLEKGGHVKGKYATRRLP